MWSSRLFSSFLLLLLIQFCAQTSLRATEDEADEYDVKDRVVRISLISGEVNLKRKGNKDWERARLNFPLVEGDTLATDRGSRLEIQFDARNFVRLAASTTIQIVALRDEGVALSVIEGTATVRLARFDRQHEYFEVDAPRTTMAAEKTGLYRIDVPSDGRVRFAVRDGGSARIYSDTSGFALRDGRTAELLVSGDNAGDWEFTANAGLDAIDEWVNDRERYLAQRLRYNVQYYDEYVWGAEDLDAYGDWAYTSDYGWIWRPHATAINIYADWAPYRYGHWVWCPPYGWTWVGYEPWGWAPYHYGRWVFLDGYWGWCPRSAYLHYRSWWRPALVVFVYVHDNYCWYPLRYHQRDPYSRYYNQPGRLTALRSEELANLRRLNPVQLRAVTTANARQIGSEDLRARRADEALARRAMTEAPLRTGLPARPPTADAATRTSGNSSGQARMGSLPSASTSTGASTRTPGVPLDDELRRSRVFNGREARPATPTVNTTTSGGENEARPTGAVTRPARELRQPIDRGDTGERTAPSRSSDERPERRPSTTTETNSDIARPTRIDPGTNSDSSEKPMRGRERIEPARPERRSESPTIEPQPQRSEPPPRVEAPPQRSEAPPRSESPRSEPRSEPSRPSRPDNYEPSRPSRSESPRSEPSRSESPRSESPRSEPSRSEPSRSAPSKSEAPRSEPASKPSRPDDYEPSRSSHSESPRSEPSRSESPRSESPRSEPSRSEPSRSEPSRSESPRSEPSRSEPSRSESPRSSDPDSRPSKPDKPRR